MAYFKLTSRTPIRQYAYDYHSHFGGILPLDDGPTADQEYTVRFEFEGRECSVSLDAQRELSLLGLVAGAGEDARLNAFNGQRRLFAEALTWVESDDNPLRKLALRADPTVYERGECAAENVYIAAVLLAQRAWLEPRVANAEAESPDLYRNVREQLFAGDLREYDPHMFAFLRHFNRKIFRANKYTPFDDAYKSRSSLIKQLRRRQGGEEFYRKWMLATFAFLHRSGVRCSQIALGADEIGLADPMVEAFNRAYHCQFRLLAHTSSIYQSDAALLEDLERKIMPFFREPARYKQVIGLDLLGTENKVAHYGALLEFLREASETVHLDFGRGEANRARAMAVHIHCGEGASADADHRSMIGYARMCATARMGQEFYQTFAAYIRRCAENAERKNAAERQGTSGAPARKADGPSGVFDELFRDDSLTWAGLQLRRFDVNTPNAAQRVAFNGKRNAMAIVEAFDRPAPNAAGRTYYDVLTAENAPFAFRLGHDFYYRSFILSKFPKLALDTNLGSNAITGASGLFWSSDEYRINRGFRHLDGYIDTDVLVAASDAVAYMGSEALSEADVQTMLAIGASQGTLAQILDDRRNRERIEAMLRSALGPIADAMPDAYALYKRLTLEIVGDIAAPAYWFEAMMLALSAFQNWRCYLLGADGQGVEHSDLQDEFLRMLLIVAYQVLPAGRAAANDTLLDALQTLILSVAGAYWATAVNPALPPAANAEAPLRRFEGYKGPSSVVVVVRN